MKKHEKAMSATYQPSLFPSKASEKEEKGVPNFRPRSAADLSKDKKRTQLCVRPVVVCSRSSVRNRESYSLVVYEPECLYDFATIFIFLFLCARLIEGVHGKNE